MSIDCRNCGGAGFSIEGGPCPACNGKGFEHPARIHKEQRLRRKAKKRMVKSKRMGRA